MASIKILLREDKLNKKTGEAPLYIRIIKDRKPRYYSLGVKLKPEQWDEAASRVRKNHPNSKRLNFFLTKKKAEAEGTVIDLELTEPKASSSKIKNKILGIDSVSWFAVAQKEEKKLFETKKIGSATSLKYVIARILKYTEGNDLKLGEINVKWIHGFVDWMTHAEASENTIAINLKMLRKIINIAIAEDLFPMDKNPFLKYKIKKGKSSRNYLTENQLIQLENLELITDSEFSLSRDVYVFACYAGGMRISDILSLQWYQFDGERVVFRAVKTDEEISIKLPRKALAILAQFQTSDQDPMGFIFPFLPNNFYDLSASHQYREIRKFNSHVNSHLRKLAKKIGVVHTMTIHTARHTWATRALRKGMRIEYVSKLLGHSDISTTQPYAHIVNKELDAAMDIFDD